MPARQPSHAGPRGAGPYSESAALVRGTEGMSYTEEGVPRPRSPRPQDEEDGGEDELVGSGDSDMSVLAQFHEDAIRQAGLGYFQWLALLVGGLGLAADTIELFVVAFILPSAEVELCIDDAEKGWLVAITFLGMMAGSVLWGSLADRMGRKRTLMSALGVHAVFGIIAALMPTFGTFMTARFCSGIGIGGVFPIVMAHFAELLSKADRAKYLSFLLMFWALGGVFVALVGWALIPTTGADVVQESKEHFSAWHQLLLVCCLPSAAAVVGLVFLPDSPRYLLEAGREVEAMMVYQRIYKTNNLHNPAARAQYQLSELELPSKRPAGRGLSSPPGAGRSVLADMIYSIEMFWNSFLQLFISPNLRVTVVLVILWFTAAFGYYGLTIWFPDYIKQLKVDQYAGNTNVMTNAFYNGTSFNDSIENTHWVNSRFADCRFHHLVLSHVTFTNCTLERTEFANIKSSRTYFLHSVVEDCRFVDTDLSEQHFRDCRLLNNTVVSLAVGCPLDFDYNIHLEEVFQENLVGQLAILPAALVSAFVVDRMGRVKMIGISMFLSSIASLFIWFLDTNSSIIIFEAIFNFVFICAWNAIDVATVESYPTHLRTTGFGFLNATCRLGGLLGVVTFRNLIAWSRVMPMLTTAAVLLVGGVASSRLAETSSVLL
ncbi:synaptic vesicle glycoprotein 2C-like [Bacillus rossius redtenbacheri]|uniref:synaptic vesicle glycoprotein 2C-like n=1 Tax=Bacillus rossius redtenbacheri TaxID=93214 RepID=UPI002FDD4EDB